ncbi:unnamed protein product [Microthlaspi erraticum]|uniref:Uncharacterized protein n=1 Tax=Microthlaspi erraticum TaxID=1685480 RepID=A0A6D2KVE3_9BRAS|nr:unnamed protein product [Microthlaspi erraticum]
MMAQSNVALLSILLMASLSSVSNGLTLFGLRIDRVAIRGTLLCSLYGDPNAPPVSNAIVYLVCGDSNSTITQAVTDPVGVFFITLNVLETVLINPAQCIIEANFPTASCQIYPPDGSVTATVNLVSIVITSLQTIANYASSTFFSEGVYR